MPEPALVARRRSSDWLTDALPKLVLSPSIVIVAIFVYGFIAFTFALSFTDSRILPSFGWVGWKNYENLFKLRAWDIATLNLVIFGTLYIAICTVMGLLLAIFLDQKIRAEGFIRTVYLYPMALSFIVTGVAWKWILDPGIGIEAVVRGWGWETFAFNWIKDSDMAIYTIVIAAVWQTSGFVMAMFLAGLRGIDGEMMKAAQIDGRVHLRALPADRDPAATAGVHVGVRRPRPHGDQVLRPRDRAYRRRPRQRHRVAGDVHVFLHLHPQPDGDWRGLGGHHADDDRRNHRPLPLVRTQGEEGMSTAPTAEAITVRTGTPARLGTTTMRSGRVARSVLYVILGLFCLYYLLPLYVMVINSLKPLSEITAGGMMALPDQWTLAPWRSAWSTAQVGVEATGLRHSSSIPS
jgi:ABC-type glycerol-3-phosphate transport system permease component